MPDWDGVISFNSKVVRLKGAAAGFGIIVAIAFQFQSGTVKSLRRGRGCLLQSRFNSKVVRLKAEAAQGK